MTVIRSSLRSSSAIRMDGVMAGASARLHSTPYIRPPFVKTMSISAPLCVAQKYTSSGSTDRITSSITNPSHEAPHRGCFLSSHLVPINSSPPSPGGRITLVFTLPCEAEHFAIELPFDSAIYLALNGPELE